MRSRSRIMDQLTTRSDIHGRYSEVRSAIPFAGSRSITMVRCATLSVTSISREERFEDAWHLRKRINLARPVPPRPITVRRSDRPAVKFLLPRLSSIRIHFLAFEGVFFDTGISETCAIISGVAPFAVITNHACQIVESHGTLFYRSTTHAADRRRMCQASIGNPMWVLITVSAQVSCSVLIRGRSVV